MKILIFEDEIYTFRMLRHMLEGLDPSYEIIGPISTVVQGKAYLSRHRDIDIIIADIQLNDGLSFDALSCAPETVPIIFTTAYDQHALKAFDYNSLSYLLKPIDEEDLAAALDKAKRISRSNAGESLAGDKILFHKLMDGSGYRERFVMKSLKGRRIFPVSSIRYIYSENKCTHASLCDGSSYLLDLSLGKISEQLDPKAFLRVNRKYIVPAGQVAGIEKMINGKGRLMLKGDGSPEIIVSRARKAAVLRWLAGD